MRCSGYRTRRKGFTRVAGLLRRCIPARLLARPLAGRPAMVEGLEGRVLLAFTPYISEFMASNDGTLVDVDRQYSDWIEIANPTSASVNLDGYYLTDDAQTLGKWRLPAMTLDGGARLVVFASGKDLAQAGAELHTNFSLDVAGDYLALVHPDGQTVLSEYAPEYPRQLGDISYGVLYEYETTPLLLSGDGLRVMVPVDGSLSDAWRQVGFDDSGWIAGLRGVGFDVDPVAPRTSGFTVRMVNVAGAIGTIDVAKSLLGPTLPGGFTLQQDITADYPVINHGTSGSFLNNLLLPNGLAADEQYTLEISADIFIPQGTWTIDAGTDDGFELVIPGLTFVDPATGASLGTDTLIFPGPRGHAHTSGTIIVGEGGLSTTLRMVYYENGGGESAELSVASGQQVFNAATFTLLGDNVPTGWEVKTTSSTPPPDYRPLVGTGVEAQMLGRSASAYVRMPLREVENPEDFDLVRLRVRYDDGFVAYLNGQEITRRNAPGSMAWNSAATAANPDTSAILFEEIDIALPEGLLNIGTGTNVLTIHGLNAAAGDSDFLIEAEVLGVAVLGKEERYFDEPTPGAVNYPTSLLGVISDTNFSHDRGFYDAPFAVTITTSTLDAEIRYTLDGSAPTATTGMLYTGPVGVNATTILRAAAFKPGYVSSNVDTQTYIFIADVINQPINPAGFPALGTTGVHWDYEMDPDVVNDPAYRDLMVNALTQIPSMSFVTGVENFFGPTGIYQNPGGTGVAWERPTSAELIYPDGKEGFQIDAGLRIYGGVNRSTNFPKHSFRLLFKDVYGAGKLNYPLFEDELFGDTATDEFDTLILRGAFNKTWPFWNEGERSKAQYIHDAFGYITQHAMGQPAIHGIYVHLYVNGLYWGLYNIVERPSAPFGESYFGGEKEDYDALNSSEPIDGTKDAWNTLHSIATAGVTTPEQYAQIQQYLDIDNLIDYMLVNFYGGNLDWDDHNWYAMRKREEGAGYMFFSWDAERMLEEINADRTEVGQVDKPSFLYKQLRTYPEFRMRFADRVQKHLFNNGALTVQQATARYWALANQIDDAVIAESARWGDFQRPQPYTRDAEWLAEQNRLVTQYFPARTNVLLNQLRADALYPTTAAPVFAQHGGSIPLGYSLGITNPNATGVIYYTLDGTDPRVAGGDISGGALLYGGPVALPGTSMVKARIWDEGKWSALVEAVFHHDLSALGVTEMMYHPPAEPGSAYSGEEYEFIELHNRGSNAIDLTGVAFTNGITFSFADDATIAAQQRIVLAKNAAAFAQRYPGVAIFGVYSGSLNNGGEKIALGGPGGDFLSFEYKDWYSLAAGQGFSLVVVDPQGDLSAMGNWRPSTGRLGTPGVADPGYAAESIVINEVMPHTANLDGDWIELHNTTGGPIDVGGWYLSDSAVDLLKYRIADGTILEAGGHIVFSELEHFGNPNDPGMISLFAISRFGDDVYLTSNDGVVAGGYRERVDFGAAALEVSFGRHIKSTGGTDFTAMSAPTPGDANALPSGGSVVITEVMYNPGTGGHEFIELKNLGGSSALLYDPDRPANTWRFIEGVTYAFPEGAAIPHFAYALVVGIEPDLFRSLYEIPEDVLIFGPYEGLLDNAGENLKLARPGLPGLDGVVPYITVEQVHYSDKHPWSVEADGTGPSLARISESAYSNDAGNWAAGPPGGTPGTVLPVPLAPSELTATVSAAGVVTLKWLDHARNESGFQIERSLNGVQFTRIGTVASNIVTFRDTGPLTGGAFYTYRVRAFNVAAESSYANTFAIRIPQPQMITIIDRGDTWRFDQSRIQPGSAWITAGYNDSTAPWLSGAAPLGYEPDLPAGTIKTQLDLGPSGDRTTAYYFRRTFTLGVDPSMISALSMWLFLDDGAAIYINGRATPAHVLGMPAAPYTYATLANRSVGNAAWEGPFTIPASLLVAGENVIAVEVHQINKTSSDIAFGLEMKATLVQTVVSASIVDVAPDPRTGPADFIDFTFSEPVAGLDMTDLQLTRSDGANLLTGAQTLTSADGVTWRLGNLAGITAVAGLYDLKLRAIGSAIIGSQSGGTLGADVIERFHVTSMQLAGSPQGDWYHLNIDGSYLEIFTDDAPGAQPGYRIPTREITHLGISGGGGDDRIEITGVLPFEFVMDGGGGRDTLVFSGGKHDVTKDLALEMGFEVVSVMAGAELRLHRSQTLSSLSLTGEARVTVVMDGDRVLRLGSLSLADSSILDIADNRLMVNAPPAESSAALAQISGWIAAGRDGAGAGIISSAGGMRKGIGVAMNDDGDGALLWPGEPASLLLALNTFEGDLNLDGRVDGDDYFRMDSGYLAGRAVYQWGDVDYDGQVTGGDYFRLDRAYLTAQGAPSPEGSFLAPGAPPAAAPAAVFSDALIRDESVLELVQSGGELY